MQPYRDPEAEPDIVPVALRVRECADCGQFHWVPRLPPGAVARCLRCNGVLRRGRRYPLQRPLALALAGLVLLVAAAKLPLMGVDFHGRSSDALLTTGPFTLTQDGLWTLGMVVLATTLAVPLVRMVCVSAVLAALHMRTRPRGLHVIFAWAETLRPWSMVEVYMLGIFVAYSRLVDMAYVELGPAAYTLAGVMLLIAGMDAALDPGQVWERLEQARLVARPASLAASRAALQAPRQTPARLIGCRCCGLVVGAVAGARCPRCDSRLRARKPDSLDRTWALLAAAAVLYIPANTLPVMTVISFGSGQPNTILSGVQELAARGMWPLAILVFFASITVPLLKLVGLSAMLLSVHRGARGRLRDRTRLYRVLVAIGRWSMIDIFMLSILVGLVRMGVLASVRPGLGAVSFCAVVILTMLAAMAFDPRLMWDAAGRGGRMSTPGMSIRA